MRTDRLGRLFGRDGTARRDRAPGVLVVVQNLPFVFDRRVRMECRELVAAGYTVSVICPRGEGEAAQFEVDGVHVYSYRPPAVSSGLASYAVEFVYCWLRTALLSLRVLRQRGFDVIQACNPPDTYWLLGLLYRPFGKRFVYDQHDLCPEVYEARFGTKGFLWRVLRLLERASYAVADHAISTNESYREVALERGRLDPDDVSIVMSSPDPDVMKRGEAHPELKQGRKHLVCYLGIMGPQDGVDRLLHAVDHYVHVLGRDDCHFGLLGFGDCLPDLQRLADTLGVTPWVTFTGRADGPMINQWLSTADAGVTPDPVNDFNDRSTMNKTLEYMAHEIPVVASDLKETRRSAGDAAVYTGADPRDLALALADLLDDELRRVEMGRVGRARVESVLAWQLQAERYVEVYRRVLDRKRSGRAAPVALPEARQDEQVVDLRAATVELPEQRTLVVPAPGSRGSQL